jgi:ferredoxin
MGGMHGVRGCEGGGRRRAGRWMHSSAAAWAISMETADIKLPKVATTRCVHARARRGGGGVEGAGGGARGAGARARACSVTVTFVNYLGERVRLPGRVGQSLAEVAEEHGYEYLDAACGGGGTETHTFHEEGKWLEPKYGEGPSCVHCHVIIPKDKEAFMPPISGRERELLDEHPFPDDVTATSRLACQIRLTKDMDNMVVFVPDGPESEIP